MFSYLKGYLTQKGQNFAVIEVSGIGFKVYTSATTLQSISASEENSPVTFYTYLYIKEGIMDLYGFSSQEELNMFELLISVSGVGAKGAIAILSSLTPSKLAVSLVTNDVASIKKASGIGPKTAQRIILELKDKIKNEELIASPQENPRRRLNLLQTMHAARQSARLWFWDIQNLRRNARSQKRHPTLPTPKKL